MIESKLMGQLPDSVRSRLHKVAHPQWFPPMLATLVAEPFSRDGWLFEPKLDGERCLALRDGRDLRLFSRNQKLLNEKYPEIVTAFEKQKLERFTVDGEIVTFDGGVTSFSKLQARMQVRHPSEELRQRIPVWIYLFDLLHLDGCDLRQVPLRYRKELLRQAFDFHSPICFTEHRETAGQTYFKEACKKRWEGILEKNSQSAYVSRRSQEWLKVKCSREQEFVIAGYTDPEGHRVGFGALLAGYYQNGRLLYAGKVGSGFNEELLRQLSKQLTRLEVKSSPFAAGTPPTRGVHWVRPKLVAQVGFTEWTPDGKLRHPRFLGLRDDKPPDEVVRERERSLGRQ